MNMAEHLSSDVGPSARVETLACLEQLVGTMPLGDGSRGNLPHMNTPVDSQSYFLLRCDDVHSDVAVRGFIQSDLVPLFRSSKAQVIKTQIAKIQVAKAKRRLFFAAATATAFYGGIPAWAGSQDVADINSSNASSMGALNASVSAAITSRDASPEMPASDALASQPFQNIDTSDVDDETRLMMAELSRLAMTQAASGRIAGAGLMWADVAFADASASDTKLREIGFSPSSNMPIANEDSAVGATLINSANGDESARYVLTKLEYSKSLGATQPRNLPRMSRATLQLVAQKTVAGSKAKSAQTKKSVSKTTKSLPPAMPLVTASASPQTTTSLASSSVKPTILRGTTSTPSRADIKATRRSVSVSPLQSSTRSSLSKNVGAGMKKVITVSSLKQLPPANQALPTTYGGSRRASIIPIGADMPASGSRAGNSSTTNSTTNSTMSALPMAPSLSPARPAASRMANQLEVATGTFVVLQTLTDLDTVAIADPTIADVAVVNSRAVLVNGKTPGITSLVIVDRDKIRQYQVRVVSAPGTLPRDIVAQIGLPGVTVRQVRDAVVLEGEVENTQEAARALEIASIYSKKVINNLSVRGQAIGDAGLAAQLQSLIGLPNVTVLPLGDGFILQGLVDNAAQRARAETVVTASGRKFTNLIELPTLTIDDVQAGLSTTAPVGAPGTQALGILDGTNITVRQSGDAIILEGVAINQARIDRAALFAARSGLQVINNIRLLPAATAEQEFAQRATAAINIPGVRASGSTKRMVVTGSVADTNVANYVMQVARSIASEVDNMLTTPSPIQINIDVSIVEINKNDARNLGVQVGAVTLGPITPGTPATDPIAGSSGVPGIPGRAAVPASRSVGTDFRQGEALLGNYGFGGFQLLDGLRFRLQALYSTGNARLLSNPRSTVLSGRTATFQVGGQVPIPSGSTTGQAGTSTTIVFKDFGILLEANPVGLQNGVVTMRVRTEVSQPDPTLGIVPPGGGGLIPGFSRRQTVTEVTVNRGGTVALGGLIQNNITQTITRIPLLSKIPILGKLFQSKQFQKNETELVIFVTPRVLPNILPPGVEAPAGISISDNTTNVGTQLGNPGITTFSSGASIAPSGQ